MTSSMTATLLGIEPFSSTAPVELRSIGNEAEVQAVICATYRQVLGNEHVMQSERLNSAESMLKQGNLSVRDFVRAIALSELYRTKFFQNVYQIRFIELNFKHLLGRAPRDQAEISAHVDRYINQGYEAEINSYLDSEEYQSSFGDMIVPYHRGFSTASNQPTVAFNRMFQLYRGYANSDRAQGNRKGRLTEELALNTASPVRTSLSGGELMGTAGGDRSQLYRIRVSQGASNRTTQIRRSISEYLVAYEQLSSTMQRLNQRGSRIVSITAA
ncbi:phycobilisome linker polypeptide [filamentous cyanobacterium LEGE 11480]|uniref:Phycobilisome linker polypeptide n=1 Tax=Romeriopsis navalis LEGE 11480 TaxID=2777977 RepID=A0A928VIG2_9CYAN|nr:phycobilisome linker polypeptide [Romeriopsis navalis]MBE9029196.1 phycobilisome linker polypeptide [Romeriopsis navalis LEGE 11480]